MRDNDSLILESLYSSILLNEMDKDETEKLSTQTSSPIEHIFDAEKGIGQVADNMEIAGRGFVKYMTPLEFLSIVPAGVSDIKTKSFIIDALKDGKKLGQPILYATWNEDAGVWEINGHEGRSRTSAIKNVYGNVLIPVHVFPRRGLRAHDITEQMRDAPFIPEQDVPRFKRTPESVTPVSIETNKSIVPSETGSKPFSTVVIGDASEDGIRSASIKTNAEGVNSKNHGILGLTREYRWRFRPYSGLLAMSEDTPNHIKQDIVDHIQKKGYSVNRFAKMGDPEAFKETHSTYIKKY
jgi:hypothetical protein